jgi:hypothetical protein
MANNETIAEREEAMVSQAEADAGLLHLIIHGDSEVLVPTEGGMVPSLAKQAVQAEAKVTAVLEEVASQLAGSATYTSIEKALVSTGHGAIFGVLSPSNKEYVLIYENVDNVAVPTGKSYSSAEFVDELARRILRMEKVASLRLPRGQSGTRFAVAVGRQLLAYIDGKGVWHSSHEHSQYLDQPALTTRQKPKKRPRSQNYQQPMVIASGSSVVMVISQITPEQRLTALEGASFLDKASLAILQKPKKRPRSRNYPHPMVIASGGSVVLATSDISPDERITVLETDRDTTSAGLATVTARLDLVENSQGAAVEFSPPQWLAREITASGEQQVMVHDGQSYRQLTPAGASWVSPVVGPGNVVRCLRDQGGVVAPYSIWPNGIRHAEGKILLQKIVTGQSLSLGSRGYVLNPDGAYVFDAAAGGVGDLFTTSIPTELEEYCLSMQGGPRPNPALTAAFVPIREYPSGVLGETICSSWALALRRWSTQTSRADIRLLATVFGTGGVPYASLKKGTGAYASAISRTQEAHTLALARGWQHVVHSISILHGESQSNTDAATYAGYLSEWLSDYTADVTAITGQTIPPIGLLSQMNTHWSGNQEIPLAQLLVHETNTAMCLIGPKYQYPYFDSAHMQAEGYIKVGEIEARAERFAMLGRKWQPLRPMTVKMSGTTITVQFSNDPSGTSESAGPVGGLVFDTVAVANPGHYGFALSDPAAVIQSVAIGSDSRSVVIQLAAAPVAGAKLEYAMQLNLGSKPGGGPRGCLRDSDTRDRSRYDGSYQFNWCVAFRKTIEVEI